MSMRMFYAPPNRRPDPVREDVQQFLPPQFADSTKPMAPTIPSMPPVGGFTPGSGPTMQPMPASGLNAAADMPPPQASPGATTQASGPETNQQHTIDINIDSTGAAMNQQPQQTQPLPPAQQGVTGGSFYGAPPVQQQPYPQPAPPTQPVGPHEPFNPVTPVPPATPAPPLAGPPGSNAPGAGQQPTQPGDPGKFKPFDPSEKNFYGGEQIAGADPSMGDYESVQDYADQAMDSANRWLEPQQAEQNRRMQQELINKGVDPNSPQGQEMQNRLAMQQADASNSAMFNALGFGQGIQNQMSQQQLAKSGLAGDMQKALWQAQLGSSGQGLQKYLGDQNYQLGKAGLANQFKLGQMQNATQKYGQDLNYQLGMGGQDLQRYGMDLSNQLGQGQLDLGRQGQDWGQMMDLQDRDFQYQQYGDMLQRGDDRYQDQMLMSLLGFNKPQGGSQIDPTGFGQALMGSAGQDKGLLGSLFG